MKALLLVICAFLKICTVTPSLTPEPVAIVPSPVIEQKEVVYQNEHYAYSYFRAQNPENITLLPNFSLKKDAQTMMTENGCILAVNGGFYDTSNKPLGFFQSGGKTYGQKIDSALVNGFVWANASGSAVISSELPDAQFHFALQSGPMLLSGGTVLPLAIHNDTPARRMIAARSTKLLFLTIYKENAVFAGPLLGDLPEIIRVVSEKEHLDITDAINLDGGSASGFYSSDTSLSELTPVGSLFCLQGVSS